MGCGNSKVEPQFSSLCEAVKAGDKQSVLKLLKKEKADPNSKILTTVGWKSPLVIAVESNYQEIVQVLLEAGADPDATLNEKESTPLMTATWWDNDECAKLLIKHGANVNRTDMDDDTALHYGAMQNSSKCTRLLLAKGANVNAVNKKQQIPLHQACHNGSLSCVRLLQQSGGDLKAVDKFGLTPLGMAETKDQTLVVEYLKALSDG